MNSGNFVNFTNHPSALWSDSQRSAACAYGNLVDYPFPEVDPFCDANDIEVLAQKCVNEIMQRNPSTVLCQGEYSLAYAVTFLLHKKRIPVVAACSSRMVEEINEDGVTKRKSIFQFVQFREVGKNF